jgi:uncharacterized protein YdaL
VCSSAINALAKYASGKNFDESVLKVPALTVLGQNTVHRIVEDFEQDINSVAKRVFHFTHNAWFMLVKNLYSQTKRY